jgi:prevent-host-death family protein
MKTINASEFKARCLAILDEVKRTGEIITILKRGKPVAQLVPPVPRKETYPQETLVGTVHIRGDILQPVLKPEVWEAEGQSS